MDYAAPISFNNWAPVFSDVSPDQTSSTFNIVHFTLVRIYIFKRQRPQHVSQYQCIPINLSVI